MIVCKGCGFRNAETETFCASCGSFLEWFGESLGTAAGGAGSAGSPGDVPTRTPAAPGLRGVPREAPKPETLSDGDIVCRACGTANGPSRRFCRYCGAELVPAPRRVQDVATPPSPNRPPGLRAKLTPWRKPPAS